MLGLSFSDFWQLTYREFSAVVNAYNEKEEKQYIAQAELARLNAYFAFIPHVKNRLSPAEMWQLPWEIEEIETTISTKDDFLNAVKKYGRK